MDDEFEITWQALVENGSSKKNRDAVKQYWDTLTEEQQRHAAANIPAKVKDGLFVQYNPILAIKENTRRHQAVEPTNYNGRRLNPNIQYVIARYKNSYGTYSLQDAKAYGMDIKHMFSE